MHKRKGGACRNVRAEWRSERETDIAAADGALLVTWCCLGSGGDRGIEKWFNVIDQGSRTC